MSADMLPLAGAVAGLRMLVDGTIAVTLHIEPKDRVAAMQMLGEPGAMVGVVRLKDGAGAAPADKASYRDLGPICREAVNLCGNERFHAYVKHVHKFIKADAAGAPMANAAKAFILVQCNVHSRKELDTAEGARELFIEHVRKPFHHWLETKK